MDIDKGDKIYTLFLSQAEIRQTFPFFLLYNLKRYWIAKSMWKGGKMKENPFLVQYRSVIILLLAIFTNSVLCGCMPQSPTYETKKPITMCTLESPLTNVYKTSPQSWASGIFEFAVPSVISKPVPPATPIPLNEGQILLARYAALSQLTKEVERWSDTKTIILDDSSKAHITITYISPELLQAVFLSEILKERFFTTGFQDQIQSALNDVAQRDELLFFLTVATTNGGANPARHTIRIPTQELFIVNAENLKVVHSHEDHNLEQTIDTLSKPVFGHLGYPLSVVSADQCKWILDPKYNKNIVFTLSYLEVDSVKSNVAYFWTIPYVPIMNPNLPPDVPDFNMPAGFDVNFMTPLSNPPSDPAQASYWQDFARFVWNQITLGNY